MLLTEEEMQKTIYSVPAREPGEDYSRLMEATCKAQLKKVVEFLNKKTIELASGGHRRIIISYEDWQSLLEEIE